MDPYEIHSEPFKNPHGTRIKRRVGELGALDQCSIRGARGRILQGFRVCEARVKGVLDLGVQGPRVCTQTFTAEALRAPGYNLGRVKLCAYYSLVHETFQFGIRNGHWVSFVCPRCAVRW